MNALEAEQRKNVKRKEELLRGLDLQRLQIPSVNAERKTSNKPKPRGSAPSRASARLASSTTKRSYDEDESAEEKKRVCARPTALPSRQGRSCIKIPQALVDVSRYRWSSWKAVAPLPARDQFGMFRFESHPSFLPNKSPEEVIRQGCFGGSYFRPLRSQKLGVTISNDHLELPVTWVLGLEPQTHLISPTYHAEVNKFKVACGQSIEEWEAAGWINHDYDVRGWFQWYIRFFQGRRCEDDDRQVSRWRKCVGDTGRWRRMLLKKYVASCVREVFDDGADEDVPEVSPVMHQTCHHWAFEVKQDILDEYWAQVDVR